MQVLPSVHPSSDTLTPKEIVTELDRHIVGQHSAKKAVAVALRNRWRRLQLLSPMREEVLPKNILMIGPTGVGKTEIARRLAKLVDAPFTKVEATKFTEVGYVGRDVDQIIRDLLENAILMTKKKWGEKISEAATTAAEKRLLDVLVGENATPETREKFLTKLRNGDLDMREIEIQVADNSNSFPMFDVPGTPGAQMGMMNLGDIFGKTLGGKTKTRKLTVKEALKVVAEEENDKLLDQDQLTQEAIISVEQNGIVFLDEIDKICARAERQGADVSREGVQRDLLPLIEGTTVTTKHGPVKTDHILFIASGAFHVAKPSDLLPELQGRLPIRVELQPLTEEDFIRILTEPESSLIKQYQALLQTEGVSIHFGPDAIAELAKLSVMINQNVENIGARRLHSVLEKFLEEISFEASSLEGTTVTYTATDVQNRLSNLVKTMDVSKFIL